MSDQTIHLHVHFHGLEPVLKFLTELGSIEEKMSLVDDQIAALTQDITDNTTVVGSVETFINGIPAMIAAAVSDALSKGATPQQLQQLSTLATQITANTSGLKAAVVANTPVSAPPTVPSTPTLPTATPTTGQIALSWPAVTGAVTYNVYRATAAGGEESAPLQTHLASPSAIDSTTIAGTAYFYTVTAVNDAGESAQSPEVTATAV